MASAERGMGFLSFTFWPKCQCDFDFTDWKTSNPILFYLKQVLVEYYINIFDIFSALYKI